MGNEGTMTPIQLLRSLFASGCKMDPYFMDMFDRWVDTHIRELKCTYTVREDPGPGQAYIEESLRRKIVQSALFHTEKKTVKCWFHPPHTETTMSIQVIGVTPQTERSG